MDDDTGPVRQDEQGAMEEPPGPGRSKTENLRRIGRQLEEQRDRTTQAEGGDPAEQSGAPDRPSERPEDDEPDG